MANTEDLNAPMRDKPDLSGRVAIVTGGGQGLGRAFAKAFADCGATAVIAELNEQRGAAVAEEIKAAGGKAVPIRVDVGNFESASNMAAEVQRQCGRIDILVNNAAIFSTLEKRPFDEIPIEEWDKVMHVNVNGPYYCCRAAIPFMKAGGWGRIVNVSSSTVLTGRPNYLHYTTSKSALVGLSRSLAREVGKFGINVNTLMPGSTSTEIERKTVTPAQREAIVAAQSIPRHEVPQDLVGVVLFLSSEPSRFMTGQTLLCDGGLAHV
jgi:NAD(P)-dependent dehydrogenase (short-subunit alcohol dehydrogenase family)